MLLIKVTLLFKTCHNNSLLGFIQRGHVTFPKFSQNTWKIDLTQESIDDSMRMSMAINYSQDQSFDWNITTMTWI